jgi:hemin uptake protein HemP
MKTQKEKRQENSVGSSAQPESLPVSSQTLFQNANELVIEHAGQHYRLRITRQNKLILTK